MKLKEVNPQSEELIKIFDALLKNIKEFISIVEEHDREIKRANSIIETLQENVKYLMNTARENLK